MNTEEAEIAKFNPSPSPYGEKKNRLSLLQDSRPLLGQYRTERITVV